MKFLRVMSIVLTIASLLFLFASTYLYIQHQFFFRDVVLYVSTLNLPAILKPDPEIQTIEELDHFIADQLDSAGVPGAAVVIISDGQLQWRHGYGYANIENGVKASPDTPFAIASISKAVMAVALMHAVENGMVDLDTDINEYLSFEVKNPHLDEYHPITLRHLATHTSTISDWEWYYANTYVFGDATMPSEQALQEYLEKGGANYRSGKNYAQEKPGEVFEYSNIASSLIGHIISEASGVPFDEYVSVNIFEPLKMENSAWFLSDFENIAQIATPYVSRNRPFDHYSNPFFPSDGLRSSANDIARFLAAIMNGGEFEGARILQQATVDEMLEKQQFSGLEGEDDIGIIWNHTKSGLIGHDGGDHGETTVMYFNPENQTGAVILTNGNPPRALIPAINILLQITRGSGVE